MTIALKVFWWLIGTQTGRIVGAVIAGLIGWATVAQYYKYEGRKQVYERIERDNKEAIESREKIDDKSRSASDDYLDRWLRNRAGGE